MEYYNTLGVSKQATPEEIKSAYRKLASQNHPDKGGDTAKFQQIQAAYETLSDPNKRQAYDNPQPQGFPGGFNFNFGGSGFPDIFNDILRQHHNQNRQQAFRTTVWITLEQVYTGGEHLVKLQTNTESHMITVAVPKGIPDGGQVRCDNVIANGVLIVEFRVHKHLLYERNGNDILVNHPISVLDLIVGSKFEITTIGGKQLEVTIQPKTQPYMHLKLAGQGLPMINTNAFGDQIIILKPFIPDDIPESVTQAILQTHAM
ncbi:MAG: DnaJ C-terminal domain-containing protein [Candidatus Nanopelagicus sp.]